MFELTVVLVLIAFNGFFALSEMSVVTARKPRLRQLGGTSRKARKALELAEHPERFLSTVQVGITLIVILTGMFGGDAIGASIGAWLSTTVPATGEYAVPIGKGLAVALITYLSIVFGELLPKRLALLAPEKVASAVALPMNWVSRIATPAVWLLTVSTRGVLRLLRLNNTQASQVTEEEIRMLVSESHEQGVIDADERKMMYRVLGLGDRTEIRMLVSESHEQGVIDADERKMMYRVLGLGDRTAESLMTPRTRINWLDADGSLEENLQAMRESPFSRFPVYRENDREVVGVLEAKSLLEDIGKGAPDLFGRLREAVFVSESTHALKLLEIFREEQQSLALVVDEYGDVTGLVTINDLMGAVIGRLQLGLNPSHESVPDHAPVIQREDGSFLIDGSLH
ncbi:hemolysin family protein, partial [Lysobacter sp. A3-1-A15]|uniref:hemolysin family protein n=1 Tax=Novilysobacter viscosus TaxID=3098602 RepID=UPI002ED7F55D